MELYSHEVPLHACRHSMSQTSSKVLAMVPLLYRFIRSTIKILSHSTLGARTHAGKHWSTVSANDHKFKSPLISLSATHSNILTKKEKVSCQAVHSNQDQVMQATLVGFSRL